jgi:hypothetical protein
VRGYFGALREMELALMKQVAALEDAGIVGRDPLSVAAAGTVAGADAGNAPANRPPTGALAAGGARDGGGGDGGAANGMGVLDIAWLNSRARDVGIEREKELVAEAKARLGVGPAAVAGDETGVGEDEVNAKEEGVPVKDEAMDLTT